MKQRLVIARKGFTLRLAKREVNAKKQKVRK